MKETYVVRMYKKGKAFIARLRNKELGELEVIALEPEGNSIKEIQERKTYSGPLNPFERLHPYDRSYTPGMIGSSAGPLPTGRKTKKKK